MNAPKNQLDSKKSGPTQAVFSGMDFTKIFFESPGRSNFLGNPKKAEGSVNNSTISQEELGLLATQSPMFRHSPFSPTRGGIQSFYETIARRFEQRRPTIPEETARTNSKSEFKPFLRLHNHNPDALNETIEKNASTSVFNYLNNSMTSLKEIMNEKTNTHIEPSSPLRLELWCIEGGNNSHSLHQSPKKAPSLSLGLHPIPLSEDLSKDEPEIIKLKILCEFLEGIFVTVRPSQELYQKLTKIDEEILNSLLQRKYTKRLPLGEPDITIERKIEVLTDIINSKSQKRPEECYKFVLTRVIKYLKKHLKESNDCPRDIEFFLYEHYFSDAAQKLNLPITDFHYPLTGQRGKFKLNSVYFDKIFKSEKFLEGANDYIQNVLFEEYKSEISKKIESLLIRWDQQLQDPNANLVEIEKNIKDYLIKNKRCKLPWTMKEVNESIERFLTLIKNYRSK